MAPTLNYDLKRAPVELYEHGRWTLLTQFIIHANKRNRCWPSTRRLVKRTGMAPALVVEARQWLIDRGALRIVPKEEYSEEEKKLPARQYVHELTGVLRFSETLIIGYLYINDQDNGEIDDDDEKNKDVSKNETSDNDAKKDTSEHVSDSESFKNRNLSISNKNTSVTNTSAANAASETSTPKKSGARNTKSSTKAAGETNGNSTTQKFTAVFLKAIDKAIGQCFFNGNTEDEKFYSVYGSRIRGVRKELLMKYPDTTPEEICKAANTYFAVHKVKELKSADKIPGAIYELREREKEQKAVEAARAKQRENIARERDDDEDRYDANFFRQVVIIPKPPQGEK